MDLYDIRAFNFVQMFSRTACACAALSGGIFCKKNAAKSVERIPKSCRLPEQGRTTFSLAEMNEIIETEERREAAWIRAYMNITGASETQARGVFMCVGCEENRNGESKLVIPTLAVKFG